MMDGVDDDDDNGDDDTGKWEDPGDEAKRCYFEYGY